MLQSAYSAYSYFPSQSYMSCLCPSLMFSIICYGPRSMCNVGLISSCSLEFGTLSSSLSSSPPVPPRVQHFPRVPPRLPPSSFHPPLYCARGGGCWPGHYRQASWSRHAQTWAQTHPDVHLRTCDHLRQLGVAAQHYLASTSLLGSLRYSGKSILCSLDNKYDI